MKQQEVFKKIGVIIKELNEQYEYLKTVDGPLNELEIELFLANSHFLGDHVAILAKLNAQNAAAAKRTIERPVEKPEAASHEQKFFEPLVRSPVAYNKPPLKAGPVAEDTPPPQIILDNSSTADNYSFIREDEPETIRHELILDETDWQDEDEPNQPYVNEEIRDQEDDKIEIPPVVQTKAEEKLIEVTPAPEAEIELGLAADFGSEEKTIALTPVPEIKEEQREIELSPVVEVKAEEKKPEPIVETAAAQYAKVTAKEKEEVLTINERMSARMNESRGIAEQLHADSISDLKKAINLNDKLLYIKDLFNGYSLAYSEAIEILNRFTGFEEAELFLNKNYAVKNNWAAKPETTGKFYAILKRRYA